MKDVKHILATMPVPLGKKTFINALLEDLEELFRDMEAENALTVNHKAAEIQTKTNTLLNKSKYDFRKFVDEKFESLFSKDALYSSDPIWPADSKQLTTLSEPGQLKSQADVKARHDSQFDTLRKQELNLKFKVEAPPLQVLDFSISDVMKTSCQRIFQTLSSCLSQLCKAQRIIFAKRVEQEWEYYMEIIKKKAQKHKKSQLKYINRKIQGVEPLRVTYGETGAAQSIQQEDVLAMSELMKSIQETDEIVEARIRAKHG